MPKMDLKEAIEVLKRIEAKMNEVFNKMSPFKSQKDEQMIIEDRQALSLAISKLQLLEQVENERVEKFKIEEKTPKYDVDFDIEKNKIHARGYMIGFNFAIDLCNAHLVKKLDAEEIERIVISCKKQTEASCPHCNKNSTWTQINSYELSQAIITHLTKNDS